MIDADDAVLKAALNAKNLKALEAFLTPVKRRLNRAAVHAPLMLSAQNLKHLSKIPKLDTDSVILNLEDGVSAELKPFALRLAALTLSRLPESDRKLIVRVNPLDEGGEEEIAFLNAYMPDGIRIPKIRTPEDVARARALVADPIELHLSVETRDAWLNLAALGGEGVSALYLGFLDLFAELGMDQALIRDDNPTIHYMLSHFLITCRAMGVQPVSFVYQDFRNMDGFEAWLALEKRLGFDAKGCIAPAQASAAMRVFTADEAAMTKARAIVALFEASREAGVTGFVHDTYGFIDEPIYKGALALLQKYDG